LQLKIVIACDKYKGNMSAVEVCNIIKQAALDVDGDINVVISPMADGGEGTVDTLVESLHGRYIDLEVNGPLGKAVNSRFGIIKDSTAVIEMSSASGLWLVPEKKRDPLETTTYGTGQLIKKALDMDCKKIIVGIGGSATNDAGMGMAQALGVKFYDKDGRLLDPVGRELINLARIDTKDIHASIKDSDIYVACDVDNPLYGKNGAAFVYAPQKGADLEAVKILDKGLMIFSEIARKDLGKDISNLKGAGAAGGLGAGLVAFLDAELKPGTEIIIEATSLGEKIKDADLVITGEGAMDNQTYYGKSAFGVAKLAREFNVPVITINGSVDISYNDIEKEKQKLFSGNFDTVRKIMTLEEAIKNGEQDLFLSAREILNFYISIMKNI
jgi:glycerate kinase